MYRQVFRYCLVGLGNTAVGYVIILIALLFGAGDFLANALGYGLGLGFAYLLHRMFTFEKGWGTDRGEITRFIVTAAISYAVNLTVLWTLRSMGYRENPAAQLIAMASYSATFFSLAKCWVFFVPDKKPAD